VLASSAASSGPVQRDSGTPVAVGQLAGQRDHRGPFQRADPPRPPAAGQVLEPVQAAGGEPAPPLADRVHADAQVRGDGPAAGGRQHDLRPQPVPVRGPGPPGTSG
jgi:hypothetical protein